MNCCIQGILFNCFSKIKPFDYRQRVTQSQGFICEFMKYQRMGQASHEKGPGMFPKRTLMTKKK
jgi:hypothetical protein